MLVRMIRKSVNRFLHSQQVNSFKLISIKLQIIAEHRLSKLSTALCGWCDRPAADKPVNENDHIVTKLIKFIYVSCLISCYSQPYCGLHYGVFHRKCYSCTPLCHRLVVIAVMTRRSDISPHTHLLYLREAALWEAVQNQALGPKFFGHLGATFFLPFFWECFPI